MFVNRVRLSLYVGVGLLVGLGLGLASAAWLVGARPTAAQTAELETAAPFDPGTPAPEGYYIAYAFAGVTDHEEVATVVHCSNPTSATADVILELYSADLADSYSHDFAIFSQRNETIATREQIFFHETQVLDTGFIQQGFGRILVEEGRQIICIAQLVEKDVERPSFIVNLDMVTPQTSPLGNNVTIPGTAPEGYSLQYMMTGFMHFNNLLNNSDNVSTTLHCTNMDNVAADVWLEVDEFEGDITTYTFEETIFGGRTSTMASLETLFYEASEEYSEGMPATRQGYLRIYVKDGDGPLVCNAQLLDPNNAVPVFMVNLPLFDGLGRLLDVGAYLPLVTR